MPRQHVPSLFSTIHYQRSALVVPVAGGREASNMKDLLEQVMAHGTWIRVLVCGNWIGVLVRYPTKPPRFHRGEKTFAVVRKQTDLSA